MGNRKIPDTLQWGRHMSALTNGHYERPIVLSGADTNLHRCSVSATGSNVQSRLV
jgi:hypothetical protein